MTLEKGTKLGPYEILSPIGAGGMGAVYRARDVRLRREVAVKVLDRRCGDRPDALARFEAEARAAAALNHPNIVVIYDVGREGQIPYLVTELLDGVTLRERSQRGPLSLNDALTYCVQIARGLAAAHALGIVHRDLKPENVFLTADGQVKLLDFGLAKVREPEHAEGISPGKQPERTRTLRTAPGVILGTVGYMSPEQVRGQASDHRADVFAFGALAYELITGRRAFAGSSPADTMSAILNNEPPAVSKHRTGCPALLDRIIARCLHKSPGQRFESMRDLAFILEVLRDVGSHDVAKVSMPSAMTATSAGTSLSAHAGQQSVAVLPFINSSADPENDYLGDGIAEDIINALSRLAGLRVAARSSSFAFKNRAADLAEVGAKLHVDTLVEGSVRKAGNRLRITAQLVNVADGYQLWSERFDRDLHDIFAVQDEIATAVAERLRVSMSGSSGRILVQSPTDNLEAYDLYLRARFIVEQRGDNLADAKALFESALALDPQFALAHVGLGVLYTLLGIYSFLPEKDAFPGAQKCAERALALDPGIAGARATLGVVNLFHRWDWLAARQDYDEALAQHPTDRLALSGKGWCFTTLARFDAGIGQMKAALRTDPLSASCYQDLAFAYLMARRFEESIDTCQDLLRTSPNYAEAYRMLGMNCGLLGRAEEALRHFDHARTLSPGNHWILAGLVAGYVSAGRDSDAEEVLAELERRAATTIVPPLARCFAYIALGRADQAFEWLERCFEERTFWLITLKVDPLFDPIRLDPRFADMVRRVGIPEAETVFP